MHSTKLSVRHDVEEYRPNRNKLVQLFVAGFVASVVMMAVGYFPAVIGWPAMDLAGRYGAILNASEPIELLGGQWWIGMGIHLASGTFLFPLLFDFLADKQILTTGRWAKGAIWGLALWFFVELVVSPLSGEGFFSSNAIAPATIAWLGLVCWLIYGISLEAMTRVRIVHDIETIQRKAA